MTPFLLKSCKRAVTPLWSPQLKVSVHLWSGVLYILIKFLYALVLYRFFPFHSSVIFYYCLLILIFQFLFLFFMFQPQGHSSLFQHLGAVNQVRQSYGNAKDDCIMSRVYLRSLPCHMHVQLDQSKFTMLLRCYCMY